MIDLTAELTAWYADNDTPRGDEEKAHVSDLFACHLATWARRQGMPQIPHDQPTRTKFALGNAVEDHVALALAERLAAKGYTLVRDVIVAVAFDDDGNLVPCDLEHPEAIVGHIDYLLTHDYLPPVVVEVKSTSFLKGRPPTEAREHYIIQGAAYAMGVLAERFAVFIVCRESGKVAEFWFDTKDYKHEVSRRAMQVLAHTTSEAFPPPPEPPYGWSCAYCRYAECAKNRNKALGAA